MAFIPSCLWGTKYNGKSACGVQNTVEGENTVPHKSMCVKVGVCVSMCAQNSIILSTHGHTHTDTHARTHIWSPFHSPLANFVGDKMKLST